MVVLQLGLEHMKQLEEQLLFLVKNSLAAHREKIIPTDISTAAFILVTTVESVVNLTLFKDPDRILEVSFKHELTQLILRYLGIPTL